MEERAKKARLESLATLRRIRSGEKEGKSDASQGEEVLDNGCNDKEPTTLVTRRDNEEGTYCEESSDDYDDDDFIEKDNTIHNKGPSKRPSAFSFKSTSGPFRAGHQYRDNNNLELTTLQNDEYFQDLLNQLELEADDGHSSPIQEKIVMMTEEPKEMLKPSSLKVHSVTTKSCSPSALAMIDNDPEVAIANSDWLDDVPVEDLVFDTGALNQTGMLPEKQAPPFEVGNDGIAFYWIDAYERNDGTIFLFGKVRDPNSKKADFISTCVIVQEMMRNLYFLPREIILSPLEEESRQEVTLGDVHAEIAALAQQYRINKFGCKKVSRRYAFEIPNIPMEAEYVKMIYPFTNPTLPRDLISGRTFSHVFGVNTSALELFLLKRKIMGPSWLHIPVPAGFTINDAMASRKMSWCRMELTVNNPKTIQVIRDPPPSPPLTLIAITLRTIIEPISKAHEIVSISGMILPSVSMDGESTIDINTAKMSVFSAAREAENLGFTTKFTMETQQAYHQGAQTNKLELAKNERALLSYLLDLVQCNDPDVLVGHGLLGFDLGVLLHRMRACKVENWSRLGRLNWSQWPKGRTNSASGGAEASFWERQITSGRLLCDTMACAKDLIRSRDYSLPTLIKECLYGQNDGKEEDKINLTQLFNSNLDLDVELDTEKVRHLLTTPSSLAHLMRHAERDAHRCIRLMNHLMIIPLTKQLTTIAGNLWSRTMTGGRAERNEFLLLHEFHRLKYICPDKTTSYHIPEPTPLGDDEETGANHAAVTTSGKKRKPTYAGGLVLEPKKGLYRNIVLLLDFNSLYPSIIQEFNICFTTVERPSISTKDAAVDELPPLPTPGTPQGILPRILANLVARRREVKKLMKDPLLAPTQHGHLHIRQQALKLTANSMYGCLGFSHSRFHARPLAMLITSQGRQILADTVEVARQQCHLEVIYGDTDSVMVHTGTSDIEEARAQGLALQRAVNERYRLLEIELESMFSRLLLLKKKKYAAVIITDQGQTLSGAPEASDKKMLGRRETKGLDLVRRDWCPLSVDVSNTVLDTILADEGDVAESIHQFLRQVAKDVDSDVIPLEKYIITKSLTKDPLQYADARHQPHVVVALRMKDKGEIVKAGDTIPYVITNNSDSSGSGMLSDHAFHPDDVKRELLIVDKGWYLAQQVHPCVTRLCEYVLGMSAASIASALGLDAARYQNSSGGVAERASTFNNQNEKELCTPWMIKCPNCSHQFVFSGVDEISFSKNFTSPDGIVTCPSCNRIVSATSLEYQLRIAVHHLAQEYYLGWMQCDEPECGLLTRQPRVYEGLCCRDGCKGTLRSLRSAQLVYQQLLYWRDLVDVERRWRTFINGGANNTGQGLEDRPTRWRTLIAEMEGPKRVIEEALSRCAYPVIDLGAIFSFVTHNAGIKTF